MIFLFAKIYELKMKINLFQLKLALKPILNYFLLKQPMDLAQLLTGTKLLNRLLII